MPDEKINVVILSTSAFPWGMAASNRVKCLAKGMMAEDIDVEYIGLSGADVDYSPDKKRSGIHDGIKYSYPGGFPVRSRTWLIRRVDDAAGMLATLFKMGASRWQKKLDAVLIYSRNPNTVLFWSKFLHRIKVPVILELCEWPLAIDAKRNDSLSKAYAFCHDAVLSVDGVIPISSYIEDEVLKISTKAGKNIPSFRIPILIDSTETNHVEHHQNSQQPYLLYTGAIYYFDIAKLVVDASAILKQEDILIKIKFTGGGSKNSFDSLKEYAQSKDVSDMFEFTGFISDEELSGLMQNATALLAPLPDNLQTISRFPTKLGYYLASGRPVITNSIGDVQQYLRDNVNALIADECSAELIAKKVKIALEGQDSMRVIGNNGKNVAFDQFHFSNATNGIRSFIVSLMDQPMKK